MSPPQLTTDRCPQPAWVSELSLSKLCSCLHCLGFNSSRCALAEYHGAERGVTIEPVSIMLVEENGARARNDLEDAMARPVMLMADLSATSRVIALRVHSEDNTTRPYYLAMPVRKPWTLTKKETHYGNGYDKGFIVFNLFWYDFQREDSSGNQLYSLNTGARVTCTLAGIISSMSDLSFMAIRNGTGEYVLAAETHARILRYDALG